MITHRLRVWPKTRKQFGLAALSARTFGRSRARTPGFVHAAVLIFLFLAAKVFGLEILEYVPVHIERSATRKVWGLGSW